MMFIEVDKQLIKKYDEEKKDYLLPIILNSKEKINQKIAKTREFQNMITHKWKRVIFDILYTDISGRDVLDVGGAYCGYPDLIRGNDYTLLEPRKYFNMPGIKFIQDVWENYKINETYDYVICSDVFLSNSNHLKEFLDKYLPVCKELRFTLTYRFKSTSVYSGWTLAAINDLLQEYGINQGRNLDVKEVFYKENFALPNARNVYIISFKGDLWKS